MSDKPRVPDISITPHRGDTTPYRNSSRKSGRAEPARQSHFNGLMVFVIGLMAIIMGVGGYALYEANQLLITGQKNIEELDARLAATGTDVSKTLQTVQASVKVQEDEIRKLWDVSNKRNKDWIKTNERKLGNNSKLLAYLSTQLEGFEKKLQTLTVASEEATAQVDDMHTQFTLMEGRVQDQIDQLTATKRKIAILEKQLKQANEAIGVIDRHRAQVNQELRLLRERLQTQGGG